MSIDDAPSDVVSSDPNAEGFGILHGSHLALVDRNLEIRGFYATDVPQEGARLLDDAGRV